MQSKSLLIAIAAFAVTATGAQAYYGNSKILTRAGLSDDQVEAIQEAQELRSGGDFMAARDLLVEAGITDDTLRSIREAARESRDAMHEAVEEGDYTAFREAIADSPLADIITTEEDFELFREAHELRQAGDWEEAQEIFDDLGVERPYHPGMGEGHRPGPHVEALSELTDEQREALQVARQANDQDAIHAILDEAGIDHSPHKGGKGRGNW